MSLGELQCYHSMLVGFVAFDSMSHLLCARCKVYLYEFSSSLAESFSSRLVTSYEEGYIWNAGFEEIEHSMKLYSSEGMGRHGG